MEKIIRDKYPELTNNTQNPIVWRKVRDIEEYVELLLAKISEEEWEFDKAHSEFLKYKDVKEDMPQEYDVAYGMSMKEVGDLLEVYDVIIDLCRNHEVSILISMIEARADFIVKISSLGYVIDDVKKRQVSKTSVFGSFREGIVGLFPEEVKAEK